MSTRVRGPLAAILAVASALSAAGMFLLAAPARAQTTATTPALVLVGQDPWTPARGAFTMLLRTDGPTEGLRLTLTVHDRVVSRSAFDATLDAANPTFPQTLTLLRLPLDDYPPELFGARAVTLDLTQLNIRRAGNGVYPVEVQLRDADDQTRAGFVTHVVVADLAAAASIPLNVAWVWPLTTTPAIALDGSVDPDVTGELLPTGRLGRQAGMVAADTDVPLTLAPTPETIDAWSRLSQNDLDFATGAVALQSVAGRHQILAGPFVPLDMPALLGAGLGSTVTAELARGRDTLETFFGAHIDPSTAMPGPLDTASLEVLRSAARSRLVVAGDALEPYAGRFTPSRPALLARADGGQDDSVTVVATDPGLERFLQGEDTPALRAAHLLSSLAVIAGEQPSLARGVAFANPGRWDPSDGFVAVVLAGLRTNPLLRPSTIDALLAETPLATVDDEPDGDPVVRVLTPDPARKPPVTAGEYYAALSSRQGIAQLFGEAGPRVQSADRTLLTVLSADLQNRQGRHHARAQLEAIGESGREFLTLIRVPGESTITLTASRAQIPLTFRNDADRRVPIHVSLRSDKLVFPDGTDRDVVLEPGKNRTLRIAVETRTSGTFPLVMTVTTAGGLPIQTSEVTVRSSFVSGVGVFLTVGAVVFLACWWAWDIRRRRRRKTA